jgi:hypothetical protein
MRVPLNVGGLGKSWLGPPRHADVAPVRVIGVDSVLVFICVVFVMTACLTPIGGLGVLRVLTSLSSLARTLILTSLSVMLLASM